MGTVRAGIVLLDLDLDFFFYPRLVHSNFAHLAPGQLKRIYEPEPLFEYLRNCGLYWTSHTPTFSFDHHERAFYLWKEHAACEATLVHIDAHSDWYQDAPDRVHSGNFILHATQHHIVSRAYWIMPNWIAAEAAWCPWDIPFNGERSVVQAGWIYTELESAHTYVGFYPAKRAHDLHGEVGLITVARSPHYAPADSNLLRRLSTLIPLRLGG